MDDYENNYAMMCAKHVNILECFNILHESFWYFFFLLFFVFRIWNMRDAPTYTVVNWRYVCFSNVFVIANNEKKKIQKIIEKIHLMVSKYGLEYAIKMFSGLPHHNKIYSMCWRPNKNLCLFIRLLLLLFLLLLFVMDI